MFILWDRVSFWIPEWPWVEGNPDKNNRRNTNVFATVILICQEVLVHTFNPRTSEAEPKWSEFETSPLYRVSSRTTRTKTIHFNNLFIFLLCALLWSYEIQLWSHKGAAMRLLGMEPRSSGRTVSAREHWAIYPGPLRQFLTKRNKSYFFLCWLEQGLAMETRMSLNLEKAAYFHLFSVQRKVWTCIWQ